MGLSQALFSAISGLSNHQVRMDNIGNNLANVNTIGFKQGVHQFNTLLAQTVRGGMAADNARGGINPLQVGLGTATSSIRQDFGQGSLETTGNQRDMAIEGNGFFVLDTGIEGEVWGQAYTRDGSFYLSSEGKLLGGEGLHVFGYGVDEDNAINKAAGLQHVNIPIGQTGGAQETTELGMTGNLNSDVSISTPYTISIASDTTWPLAAAGDRIYAGSVQTSAGLWNTEVSGGGAAAPADATTLLEDMQYVRGTQLVSPFSNINTNTEKEITISFRKGGRRQNATFTYGANPAGDGTTLNDMLLFLNGGVNNFAATATDERLTGGAMGTIHVRERTAAVHGYDATREHGGAFFRDYLAADAGAVDYDNDGANDITSRVSIVSNLGEENAITDIEISYNNVTYTDIFSQDPDYGVATGGSTTANLTVYDSLGNPHNITMQMSLVNRDTNFSTWRWIADSADDTDATWVNNLFNDPANPSTSINVGTGLIRFDNQGSFVRGSELSETGGIEVDRDNMGTSEPIQIGITEGLSTSQDQDLNFSVLTQVAASFDFNLKDQDGSAPGTLDSFSVTADGTVNGIFSNGVITQLGQIAVALIPNPNGLLQVGQNNYIVGPASGDAQIDVPEVGGRGSIRAGTLELSNVDLSKEFTNLIVTERGFQANARVISTSDEMLVELVNLKR
ncbi:MAG: flagellar hook protein FlgE [Planctomycetota bacterium]|jgi:flagellar hook protein FlgE